MKAQKATAAAAKKKQKAAKKRITIKKIHHHSFPVVALGGSAGSFSAFEKFFLHIPANSDMAFVVIMHLDPNHKSKVAELIQNFTPMPVTEAQDGLLIQPNEVYLIPPNKDMGLHNGKLLLLTPSKPKGYRMPIDYFFQSLAEDQWNKAVGIIFSGMGSDGETGVRMIKEKLGMVMVQDPETAEFSSMPKSAIGTNLVDYVVEPEEMPVKLIQYLKHPVLRDEPNEKAISETRNNNAFQKILMMLRSHTGHDFSLYKKNTITRRIDRRLAFQQLPDYSQYVNFLRENPHELNVLFNELLIGVTKFFRDSPAFDALKEHLLPVLDRKKPSETIRVWVPGCSTGEEAYTIAILLIEYLETVTTEKPPKVQIFATDLDESAIEHGRHGFYRENIVSDVSLERMEKYFTKKSNGFLVKKELRDMIVFAQHNVIKDAPFTRLDLLSCRNLMIYLTADLQKKIIPVFHYSLNPNGLLLLGPAETIGGFTDMFEPVNAKWKLSKRKDSSATVSRMIDFPFNISNPNPALIRAEIDRPAKKATLQEHFYKILLENYTPASVLLNDKGDILYVNGKTGRFLELSSGEAVMNIHRLARPELKYALSNAIHQAKTHKGIVTIPDIKLKDGAQVFFTTIKVIYLEEPALQDILLVIFEEKDQVAQGPQKRKGLKDGLAQQEIEKELLYTKQQLNSTIEQMETSLEELKSTNEELQSTNEELQSTNEESLTTKEEMQALNEELMTINMQYQSKAEELTQMNNDMKNLLESTDTGTIFLDNHLKILRFTPQIKKLFNVIETDLGRSITHIVSNLDYEKLEDDITEVIEKLKGRSMDIKTKKNEWYNLRILPYRTLDNFISGAVLTFIPISHYKALENRAVLLEHSANALVEAQPGAAILIDSELKIILANRAFLKFFRLKSEEINGTMINTLANNEWKTNKLDRFFKKALTAKAGIELSHNFSGAGIKKLLINATPITNHENQPLSVLITFEEKKIDKEKK